MKLIYLVPPVRPIAWAFCISLFASQTRAPHQHHKSTSSALLFFSSVALCFLHEALIYSPEYPEIFTLEPSQQRIFLVCHATAATKFRTL